MFSRELGELRKQAQEKGDPSGAHAYLIAASFLQVLKEKGLVVEAEVNGYKNWVVREDSGQQEERRITGQSDDVLRYFLQHLNQVCTFEELETLLWPGDFKPSVPNDNLRQVIKSLRISIREMSDFPYKVESVRGRGYRLTEF